MFSNSPTLCIGSLKAGLRGDSLVPCEDADIEVDELDCLDLDVLVTTVEIPEARRPLVQGQGCGWLRYKESGFITAKHDCSGNE